MNWHLGRVADGGRYLESDREAQLRFGLTPESSTLRWIAGEEVLLLEMSGAWVECLQKGRAFVNAVRGKSYLFAPVLQMIAGVKLAQGDVPGALADSERGLELSREIKDSQQIQPALVSQARILEAAGRRRESGELVDEFLALEPDMNEWWLMYLPSLMLDLGREAEYFERTKTAIMTPWLEAGNATAARDFLSAAAIYGRIGARGIEAIVRLHAAEDAAAAGRRAEADEELMKALRYFERERATFYLRRCEVLLAAAS